MTRDPDYIQTTGAAGLAAAAMTRRIDGGLNMFWTIAGVVVLVGVFLALAGRRAGL